jgi:predicted nucleotidyltransferase
MHFIGFPPIEPMTSHHPAIPQEIWAEILQRLNAIEREEQVRILLAVESGSRAWGFASPNSDYDVRFIYVRPKDWYLSIDVEDRRDVIERGIVDDIDLGGWDVRKALRLLWSSNPALVEWLQSPITYSETGPFRSLCMEALPLVYNTVSGHHHYRSMAARNFQEHLTSEQVMLKKYFYVLRPLLAVRWIDKHGTAAPIEFEKLLGLLDPRSEVVADIYRLLAEKKKTPEKGLAAPIPSLNAFIQAELQKLEATPLNRSRSDISINALNSIFTEVL